MSAPPPGAGPSSAEPPLGQDELTRAARQLGVEAGMVLLVHASLRSFGRWLIGGPVALLLALEEAIGPGGTLVMPTHSADLSDPQPWQHPAVPESWWPRIREELPAFRPDLTPTYGMGQLAECFRRQEGTVRSDHPQVSFAARGPMAEDITRPHPLADGLGDNSPLARLYDLGAWVLLIGVDHSVNTSLHLAEYRAEFPGKRRLTQGAPVLVEGVRQWVTFPDVDIDSDDFGELGHAFEASTDLVRQTEIGASLWRLMPQRPLVDFAADWLLSHR